MIEVHSSNRMERLAEDLARTLARDPPKDPMAPLWVVVPSRGMERFLADHLAMVAGISAQVRHAFPARIVRALLRSALEDSAFDPDLDVADPWDPDSLTWTILEEFPALRRVPEFQDLARYLEGMEALGTEVRREEYRLARMAANLLDEVAAYRPQWARSWSRDEPLRVPGSPDPVDEAGARARWQRVLWQAMERRLGPHPLARLPEGCRRLEDPRPIVGLPNRLSLFGISALPPAFLDVFFALGCRDDITVRLDLLTCTRGFLGDIPKARQVHRLRREDPSASDEDLHAGHPLVQSFGGMWIDFNRLLAERLGDVPEDLCEDPVPSPDGKTSQLRILQQQMLNGVLESPPDAPVEPDGSIVFHSTHTLARQVQALRDQVLAALEEDPTLQPRDFLVMCADVEATAPLIQAVFGLVRDDRGRLRARNPGPGLPALPVGIADRRPRDANPVAHALMRLLELARGRFRAGEVLDFLALDPVREQADLSQEDIDRLAALLEEAGVRHGVDEGHRAAEDLPASRRHTWEFGIDRLVFGAAASPFAAPDPMHGVAPHLLEDPEDLRRVGRFARFFGTLREVCAVIRGAPFHLSCTPERTARSPDRWFEDLSREVPRVVRISETRAFLWHRVLEALAGLGPGSTANAAAARPIDLWALQTALEASLESGVQIQGLLQGGINFSGLVPMRAIPFRVVALLGLDEETFPRKGHRSSFDLLGRHPAPGDRNPRDEDRHLLLEALLSARDRFWVFWNGRGVRDNQPRPLPVPLEEMLDVVVQTFHGNQDEERRRWIVDHRMQPFHPDQFSPALEHASRRSFDQRMLPGARALVGPRSDPRPFASIAEPLGEPASGDIPVISIKDLEIALRNPARHLLERRLRAGLSLDSVVRDEMDPIDEGDVDDWNLLERLLRWIQDEEIDFERALSRMQAEADIPSGTTGRRVASAIWRRAMLLHEAAREVRRTRPRRCQVDLVFEQPRCRLIGAIPGLHDRGLLVLSPREAGGGILLRLWLQHLAVSAMEGRPKGPPTWLFQLESMKWKDAETQESVAGYRFDGRPCEEARATLGSLLVLWRKASMGPLPLFPRSSYEYARQSAGGDDAKGRTEAAKKWAPQDHDSARDGARGDLEDPYVARVFGEVDPWGPERPEWMRDDWAPDWLAHQVYGPILRARKPLTEESETEDDPEGKTR
ncbi:MAG TPA: exodeoxyribonuclease V subunit gamma [Myxococcota bacterium]|nr:exodeoxyribonuclease V subunit gamma [Myxococcota bacterium]HQK51711.1 exodeoxyribonuclease V subunit gamma [Myxococcota bacterium]